MLCQLFIFLHNIHNCSFYLLVDRGQHLDDIREDSFILDVLQNCAFECFDVLVIHAIDGNKVQNLGQKNIQMPQTNKQTKTPNSLQASNRCKRPKTHIGILLFWWAVHGLCMLVARGFARVIELEIPTIKLNL